jgi:hypothetical protein
MSIWIILGICIKRLKVPIFLIAIRSIKVSEVLFHLTNRKAKVIRVSIILKLGCVLVEEELLPLLSIDVWWVRIIAFLNFFGIGHRGKLHVVIANYLRSAWHWQVTRLFALAYYVWSAKSRLLEWIVAAVLEILLLDIDLDVRFFFLKSLRLALDSCQVILAVFASLGLAWVITKRFND